MIENVFQEIWRKFCSPWRKPAFYLYFFIFIVGISGCGVVLAAIKANGFDDLSLNLAVYALTLLVPSAITILFALFSSKKNIPSTIFICVGVLLLAILLLICSYNDILIAAIISVIIAWFFWIVANCDNEYMDDKTFGKTVTENVTSLKNNWDED